MAKAERGVAACPAAFPVYMHRPVFNAKPGATHPGFISPLLLSSSGLYKSARQTYADILGEVRNRVPESRKMSV